MKNFERRHIGSSPKQQNEMLKYLGLSDMEELIQHSMPDNIRMEAEVEMDPAMSEYEYLEYVQSLANMNRAYKNYIGQGYYGTITPSVVLRNVLENPAWYTPYTPYQAEISQGRLESLLNFQTAISDLCSLPIANASLLDEATAAAEAMHMLYDAVNKREITHKKILVDKYTYEQTIAVLESRAEPLGIQVEILDLNVDSISLDGVFAVLVQYPNNEGLIQNWEKHIAKWQENNIKVIMATDLMALSLLKSPGEMGADVALGNSQRFGVPLGYGGPHAAFFACKEEYKRDIPGRIIGVSIDANGNRALRMALQTREQHIRREKATSNICTAQALLANMAAMYAVYHGPDGIKSIAENIHGYASQLVSSLKDLGFEIKHQNFFDTVYIQTDLGERIKAIAENMGINFGYHQGAVQIALDETIHKKDLEEIISVMALALEKDGKIIDSNEEHIPSELKRTSSYMQEDVFNIHHSETQMMRYIKSLERKDLGLNTSMISLGSCTMKLNAATELIPITWPEFANIHPHAPLDQTYGYQELLNELKEDLCKITGFDACSLQPNSGAQGEYAGLYTIRDYHIAHGDKQRNLVLIPISAHGTNPASAAMMGMDILIVACDEKGNIDVEDLRKKAEENKDRLAALMVTYPSTHGVFEKEIKEICQIIHDNGGQVYMDGANMNAQVFYTSPAIIGADVCHLNLHKTFAIPHGGGGPGMGPICCKAHLEDYLPSDPLDEKNGDYSVSAAKFGSALILIISHAYIKMLGYQGLKNSTANSILNANYMRKRLEEHFPILYTNLKGYCAHEFILDLRPYKKVKIEAEDVAKRLMDYNFHAPTISFPVVGTFMIEPTESEDKDELDRFCDAMISIKEEIDEVMLGEVEKTDSALHHAPHTMNIVIDDNWDRKYSREKAAFPIEYVKNNKFWPSISRINNTFGDRNLICTCAPTSMYAEESKN